MSKLQNNEKQLALFVSQYKRLLRQAPRIAGIEAIGFYKTGFRKQGQLIGGRLVKWQKRGFAPKGRKGRKLLRKTGALYRGFNFSTSGSRVRLYNNVEYALTQNDGATIDVTAKMRRFFFAMYIKSGGKIEKGKAKGGDKFWLKMIGTKTIHIPSRPMFYDTPDLAKRLDRTFTRKIENIFK